MLYLPELDVCLKTDVTFILNCTPLLENAHVFFYNIVW